MEIKPETLQELLELGLPTLNPFLTSDMGTKDAARLWLKKSLLKKWEPPSCDALEASAIQLWKQCNDKCADWREPDWTLYEDDIISHGRDILSRQLLTADGLQSRITWTDALQLAKHGKGSSAGTKALDFYSKAFGGVITCTSKGLYAHYRSHLSDQWLYAENWRSTVYETNVISGSKLSTVRKNADIDRTTCSEPSLNMFYQLGAGLIMRKILKESYAIDMPKQQDKNRLLAKSGSVHGNMCTIDLKSASDLISTKFVKWYLPSYTFSVLDSLRSKVTVYKGREIKLDMFASMGNGFTFPLQTLIFASLLKATYAMYGIPFINGKNCAVYGDDIICDKQVYHVFCRVLARCGFVVNDDKSFATGGFRESCGADFFHGQNIRGVYIRKLRNESHVYSSFNRIARWSAVNGISVDRLLIHLKGLVNFRPVPLHESDDSGFHTPRRYVTSRKRCPDTGAEFYSCITGIPFAIRNVDAKMRNPAGAVITCIGGFARDNTLTLRSDSDEDYEPSAYKVVKKKSSSWDYTLHPGLTTRALEITLLSVFEGC